MRLAISAKHLGARFEYRDGLVVIVGLKDLPPIIRRQIEANIDDVRSVIAEHSIPHDYRPSDAVDAARKVIFSVRRGSHADRT
jgi:hypothetical protein